MADNSQEPAPRGPERRKKLSAPYIQGVPFKVDQGRPDQPVTKPDPDYSAPLAAGVALVVFISWFDGGFSFSALPFGLGPLAVFLLGNQADKTKNRWSGPAKKWMEMVLILGLVGLFYSGGIALAMALVLLVVVGEAPFSAPVLAIAHFIPHACLFLKKRLKK